MRYSGNSSIQVVSSLKNSKIRLMINIVLQILNRLKCQKKSVHTRRKTEDGLVKKSLVLSGLLWNCVQAVLMENPDHICP